MKAATYHVQADWDPEAAVWVATSDDIPGLATEATTIEALTEKLRTMIPELLEANDLLPESSLPAEISFELTSHRQEQTGARGVRALSAPFDRVSRSSEHPGRSVETPT